MKFKNIRKWKLIGNYCIGWTLAFLFFIVIRGEGTRELGAVQLEFRNALPVSFFFGFFFGSISGYGQILMEEYIYKKISLRRLLILRFVYTILFLCLLIITAYTMVRMVFGIHISLHDFIFEPGSIANYLYIISVDLFMFILRQVNLYFGESNLSKLLIGKFYTPREEERIFMFLDLQSSTKLAEKLGHIKYSLLIQDCFNDLGVVVDDEAEIYQYVGDEVILTWKLNNGIKNQNCLNAYFNFKETLEKRKAYYLKSYDCLPFFKAGLNAGRVTVTEVGKYKKEIAYHGDTINTASRIQDKCSELNQGLLLSEGLKSMLSETMYSFKRLGSISLKGKEKEVVIYSASEHSN